MLSQSHIIGRMIAVAEYAAKLASEPLSKQDIAALTSRPGDSLKQLIDKYTPLDRKASNRYKNLIGRGDIEEIPETLTGFQKTEAESGYKAEVAEIAKGALFAKIRAQTGLSQEEFSQAIGMARSLVAGIESQRRNCPAEKLEAATRLLESVK